ncbi:UDP-glycosyltransferase 74E1-like [Durio zibethinus]|uniref:Glycosyltransferase n=1 Tax=Durio zibethinus TaxID=66656 RepID=A0A6P6A9B6_DURZI|nr:UDP-glycosyltransferase 74E1-like [Durio zibethinus]
MKKQENVCETQVLVLPFPVQGHVNPMLQFSKRLVSKGLEVTLLTFTGNKPLAVQDGPVKLEPISDDLEADNLLVESPDAYLERFKAVVTLRLPQIIAKLGMSKSNHSVSCLIYDSVIPWALDIAKQQGLHGAAFFTQSCAVNTIFYNVHEGLLKVPLAAQSSFSIVGLPLLEEYDLPTFVYDIGAYPALTHLSVNQFLNFRKADWVLVNTFTSLEEEVLSWMGSLRSIKTIGPTIPSKYLDKRLEDDKDYGIHLFKPEIDICNNWLNSKETGSVVYVSFGSLAALGEEQMKDLALGLKGSNSYFLWVVRETEKKKLPANFLEESSEKGLVVSWSPQLEVLAHKAVGCFMTHCGWNSTLEALSLGVPMVAVPQFSDQTTNAKLVADVWQVGIRARMDDKGIITKEEIERCIREIMGGDKSKAIKWNSDKWKKLAVQAVNEGGSSDKNIDEFVAQLRCK